MATAPATLHNNNNSSSDEGVYFIPQRTTAFDPAHMWPGYQTPAAAGPTPPMMPQRPLRRPSSFHQANFGNGGVYACPSVASSAFMTPVAPSVMTQFYTPYQSVYYCPVAPPAGYTATVSHVPSEQALYEQMALVGGKLAGLEMNAPESNGNYDSEVLLNILTFVKISISLTVTLF